MKFKRWAAGIAALLLILSMGLISCAKPAGGTPEDNPVPQEEEEEEEIVSYKFGFSCISMENPYYETLEASIREAIEESGSTLISRDPKGGFYGADPADPGHDCRRNPGYFLVSGGLGEDRSGTDRAQRGGYRDHQPGHSGTGSGGSGRLCGIR